MIASDIMRRNVHTIHPGASAQEAARLLSQEHISGAPVVDANGKVIGIVTEADIVHAVAQGLVTVAKLPGLSHAICNSFERDDRSDGKARTETVPCGSSRSRTGFAPDDGAALDQSRAYSGGAGGP